MVQAAAHSPKQSANRPRNFGTNRVVPASDWFQIAKPNDEESTGRKRRNGFFNRLKVLEELVKALIKCKVYSCK